MPVRFKCNVCGSHECYKIDTFSDDKKRYGAVAGKFTNKRGIFNYNYSTNGKVGLKVEISSTIDSYVCKNCGHVEFYATKLLDKISNDEQYYRDKVKVLEAQLKTSAETIERFRKEYSEVNDEYLAYLKGCSIKDSGDRISYETKKHNYNDRLKAIMVEIEYENYKVRETEGLIKEYRFFLENVFNVVFR